MMNAFDAESRWRTDEIDAYRENTKAVLDFNIDGLIGRAGDKRHARMDPPGMHC